MPSFALSGTFCALNKGDAAMQLGTLKLLREQFEDANITILSSYPDIDRATYPGVPLCRSSRRRPVAAFAKLGLAVLWRFIHGLTGLDLGVLTRSPELHTLRHADALIDLSGDTLTEDYGIACVISHLMPILTALALGRPVVICAQTIGPFGMTRPIVRFALNRVSIITAREQLSVDYLRDMGVAPELVEQTADIAFLLDPAPPHRATEILRDEAYVDSDRPKIGVTVSRLIGHRFSPSDSGKFAELMASVADQLIEELGIDIILLSHVTGPGDKFDDRIMAAKIHDRMKRRGNAALIDGDYAPAELRALIGKLDAFVGVRMHANISALAMRVPTLAIAYSRKTYGIMQTIGQESRVVDIATLSRDSLHSAITELWRDRHSVRQELMERMPEIEKDAVKNGHLIRDVLARRPD